MNYLAARGMNRDRQAWKEFWGFSTMMLGEWTEIIVTLGINFDEEQSKSWEDEMGRLEDEYTLGHVDEYV
jgi:hypothetical protein